MTNTKKIALKTLIITSFVFAFMLFTSTPAQAANCGGAVQCECGDTLIESHTMDYDLGDVTTCPVYGIIIRTSDITLDCAGHTISGSGIGGGIDIQGGISNITIKNCTIDNFDIGIQLVNVDNFLIQDNTVGNNTAYGIYVDNVNNSSFINNIVENNTSHGIFMLMSNDNLFDNNVLNNNIDGFYSLVSNRNQFINNIVENNTRYGIFMLTSNENDIWANTFINNSVHVEDDSVINNYYIGTSGNHWDDFEDNEGYPNHYEIKNSAGVVVASDLYPNVSAPVVECEETITQSLTMTNDLVDCPDNGIIIGASDITLDCDGHSISGIGNGAGISSQSNSNITIQNCNIDNFYYGIDAQYLYDSNIINNVIENNGHKAINVITGTGNLFDSNTLNNNDKGMTAMFFNQNQFTNNKIINNNSGLRISYSDSNDFWQNTFTTNNLNVYYSATNNNNNWYVGTSGNFWDDLELNIGYPDYYEILPGINDMFPNVSNPDTYCGGAIPCKCGDTLYTDHTMDYDLNCNTAPNTPAINIARNLVDLDCAGHTISGIGNGIGILNERDSSSISNCNIDNFYQGLILGGGITTSTNHIITNNSISNTEVAIRAIGGQTTLNENILLDSYVHTELKNFEESLYSSQSLDNKLMSTLDDALKGNNSFIGNTIYDNNTWGISSYGDNNTFDNNTAFNNQYGVSHFGTYDQLLNNNIYNNITGITVGGSYGTYIENEVYSNTTGISVVGDFGTYTSNEIYSNGVGMSVLRDSNNISSNNFYDNIETGLDLQSTTNNNTILDNTFTNNTTNAIDYGTDNIFNNGVVGNFWDDLESNPGFPDSYLVLPNGNDGEPISYTVDVDGDGYFFNANQSIEDEDCNDNDPNVNPGMPEIINGIDDNCNGRVDEHSKPRIIYMMEALPIVDGRFFR